ncbi:MAG: hypothetical protein K2P57_06275 [Burkholderiales bacterium]|nr:hypothetical protein [Burkholderiales bacterium]
MFVSLQRPLQWALNLGMLAALCALAAHWTWDFFAPDQVVLLPQMQVAQQNYAAAISGNHLFGGAASPEEAQLPPGLKLMGVFAPGNASPGAAIFFEQGRGSRAVEINAQIAPGFFLEAIAEDHVVLTHNGARTTLKLEQIAPVLDLTAK